MPGKAIPLTKVLVITHDTLGQKMAGPAIRALEIARTLNEHADVTLVSVTAATLENEPFPTKFVDEEALRHYVDESQVLIFQGFTLQSYPWIAESDAYIVADLYDPMNLEILEQNKESSDSDQAHLNRITAEALTKQLERADFMICASEKQRDMWLGQLSSLCRVNHLNYRRDPSLRSLIDVVPFGIQREEPVSSQLKIKGVISGITETDRVIIWGGGIYNWFDPLTLIRAVGRLSILRNDIKLYFLGAQHPNPHVPAMQAATDAHMLASQLGLLNKHVFFHHEWVDYENRADYLLDADIGVSTHFDHIETSFSFRTRILDYFWAGLPTVCTQGDSMSALIEAHALGITVPPLDEASLAEALDEAIYGTAQGTYRRNVQKFRNSMRWPEVLSPLISYCQTPTHAADYRKQVGSVRELERQNLLGHVEELAAQIDSLQRSLSFYTNNPLARAFRRFKRLISPASR